jgi:hypothetical protein
MDPLHVAHLVVVSIWAGLVLAESALELGARDDDSRRAAALLHYRLDLLFEIPLLVAILATGAVLTARARPLSDLHYVKIGAGLVAVFMTFGTNVLVILRRRRVDDAREVERLTKRIVLAGAGLPFGVVAAYLGLTRFLA